MHSLKATVCIWLEHSQQSAALGTIISKLSLAPLARGLIDLTAEQSTEHTQAIPTVQDVMCV